MGEAYYIYPDVLALETATGEERKRICRRIAAHVDDRRVLRTLFGIDPDEFSHFYPDMEPVELSTEDTIDTFLDRFGKKPDKRSERIDDKLQKAEELAETMPEDLPVIPMEAPSVDYAGQILDDDEPLETADDDTSSAIDAFLKAVPPKMPQRRQPLRREEPEKIEATEPEKSEEPAENTTLTEGLVRIMIKNRNYQKALEIITELSLKNPKKSIYFADQIRFLKKLIINETKQ